MSQASPTLRQVAEAAGVHHTTLSRALRGHPDIAPARAEALRAFAQKMGYVPDPMLRALAAYRSGRRPAAFHSVIAWLNPTPVHSYWRQHRTFRNYFQYAEERAKELGFKLEEISIPQSGRSMARVTSILNARNINAVIVVPAPTADVSLDHIDWRNLAAVRIGYTLVSPVLHSIAANHHGAIRMVIDELRQRGYTKPGLCMASTMDEKSNRQWSAAYMREQLLFRSKDRIPYHLFPKFSHEAFCRWIDRYQPDALIVVGDDLIPESLERHGLRVPEDIGLAALVQPEHADVMSGIAGNNRGVGRVSVDFVVAMLNRQERGIPEHPQILLIDNLWIERGTLRPRLEA